MWLPGVRLSPGQRSVENGWGAGAGGAVKQPLSSSRQLLGQLWTVAWIWLVRRHGAQMDLDSQLLMAQRAA